ncbi:MAG: site-specific integrase [Bacteroidales bacterium]|nr:site-specific integrase [Bacteroidales bacterium]
MRITADRKSKYIYFNVYIFPDQWDEANQKVRKNHTNASQINTLIKNKLAEAQLIYLDQEIRKKLTTSTELKNLIKRKRNGITFFKYAQEYLNDLYGSGKIKVYKSDKSRIENFKKFMNNNDPFFEDISTEVLKQFVNYLKGKKSLKPRSIINHLILIRTLYNKAISDSIVEQNYYPYGRGKLTIRIPDSQKIGLDEVEIKKIEKLGLQEKSMLWHTRNVFLLSFNFAGMRIGDLLRLKWGDFRDGRLFYVMGKNNKPGSIKINFKATEILERYKPENPDPKDYVFPELKQANQKDPVDMERKVNNATKNFNKSLKTIAKLAGINKNLFNHIARHSFGYIAGDKIPIHILQNLYRHSSIITTANYQQSFTNKEIDNAIDKVLDF